MNMEETNMIDERIIEITVTSADIAEMRAEGIPESEIPALGSVTLRADTRCIVRRSPYRARSPSPAPAGEYAVSGLL